LKIGGMISFAGRLFIMNLISIPKPEERTAGISSRVPGADKHIVLIDYDNINLSTLEWELRALQSDPEFRLGTFHLLQTRPRAFGCICLDEVDFHTLRLIQFHTTCDIAYKTAPRYDEHRACVLRVEEKGNRPKPTYLKSLLAPSVHQQHLGTAILLNAYFGVPMEFLENSDGNEKISIEEYLTGKRVR